MSTTHRPLALLLLAAVAVAPTVSAAPVTSPAPAVAPRVAVDPTGTFDWSLEAQGQVFSGSIKVTKVNDTTYAAVITHATIGGEVKATSVKLEGDVLTVLSQTEYGPLTQQIKFTTPLEGAWSVGDGAMGGGMKVTKRKE